MNIVDKIKIVTNNAKSAAEKGLYAITEISLETAECLAHELNLAIPEKTQILRRAYEKGIERETKELEKYLNKPKKEIRILTDKIKKIDYCLHKLQRHATREEQIALQITNVELTNKYLTIAENSVKTQKQEIQSFAKQKAQEHSTKAKTDISPALALLKQLKQKTYYEETNTVVKKFTGPYITEILN